MSATSNNSISGKDDLLTNSEKVATKSELESVDEDGENDQMAGMSLWLPSTLVFVPNPFEISLSDGQIRSYMLTEWQKVFLILEDPKSW